MTVLVQNIPDPFVYRASTCTLTAASWRWSFPETAAEAIAAHWHQRQSENPHFFNGRIFMMRGPRLGETFSAELFQTNFADFLYWRENGFPDAGVFDGFGSALLRSADGSVILGRQGFGHINSGLTYLPGGFIDPRDCDPHGRIDIAASIAREIAEETGIPAATLSQRPGYLITRCGASISIAVEYVSQLPTGQLLDHISAHLQSGSEPELEAALAVSSLADLSGLAMPPYARPLLEHVLGSAANSA